MVCTILCLDIIKRLNRFTYLIKNSAGTCQKMLFLLADTVTCYEKIKDFSDLRNNARFWLEGIAITLLGLVGLAGNFLSIAVLNTYKTNTSFNRLLMSLAVVDSLLIIDMVLEKAVIGNFIGSEPIWYKISYPYFWHPCKGGLTSEGIDTSVRSSSRLT